MLNVQNLGFRYPHHEWLFRDLSFKLENSEVMSVLGPNARGKTTLLSCLAHIKSPLEGQVETDGLVGFVPQSHAARHQFSVREMVLMGRGRKIAVFSTPSVYDHEKACEALERVGIEKLANRTYAELSGGMKQLTLIARALVADPHTLILDEPTSALDMKNQRRVIDIIKQLAQEGMAVLFTTHDPAHALTTADQVLVMDRQQIELGPPQETLTQTKLSQLYGTTVAVGAISVERGMQTVVAPDLSSTRKNDCGKTPCGKTPQKP